MHDVAVIGGGPGGLVTAARLAARGHDVVVLEEHAHIGSPVHCTGILAADAIDGLGAAGSHVLNTLTTAVFHSPSGATVSYTPPKTEAVVIDRLALDRDLSAAASAAGARLVARARVAAAEASSDGVRLRVRGHGDVQARAVVIACGASYGLQRRLGLGLPSVYLNSAQAELPASRGGDVEIYFGSATAPKGFAWAVPVSRPTGPHVRIGLMTAGPATEEFQTFLARIGRSWGVDAGAPVEPHRRLLPLGTIRRTYGPRVLAVGDAAGIVKPTTGGGIYYSVVSGEIAAEVLDQALGRDRLDAESLSAYESQWRRRLMPELRAQLALRMVLQRLQDHEIDALFELARTNGIMPLVRATATFNRHRDFVAALFRHADARRILFRRLIG